MIRAHLRRYGALGRTLTYGEYASRAAIGRRLVAGPFSFRAGAVLGVVGIVLIWVALRVLCPPFGLVR